MTSCLPLKPGATPERTLEILNVLLAELQNLPGKSAASANVWETFRRRQQHYMTWINNAESQLGNYAAAIMRSDRPAVS